jgi:predicted dehydrogenase
LADLFPERIPGCLESLEKAFPERVAVPEENRFHGFDAYKQVMASDVDVVLLCTTPHFRPQHMEAAVAAGKHVFCEKPVAVDVPGCKRVLEACRQAREKSLAVVSGLCWRYDLKVREVIQRIQDGAIGDIVAIQENYLTGTLWHRGRKPEWSEMEYQLQNWLYFTWLSGDHIAEQHIHSLDKALWLNNDEVPVKCVGMGGRQVRTEEKWGNVYDHFACCFEWENGVKAFTFTRQMAGCANDVDDYVLGSKGNATFRGGVSLKLCKRVFEKATPSTTGCT